LFDYLYIAFHILKPDDVKAVSIFILGFFAIWLGAGCSSNAGSPQTKSGLKRERFQRVVNGDSTDLFFLTNTRGMEVCITNYGGRVVSLMVPDTEGVFRDVVLGFDDVDEYLAMPSSFGATVGRYANRIANGQFVLDGDTIQLDVNSGPHTIHGGRKGWQYQVFDADQPADSVLVLSYLSPDGESGFPGNVSVTVTYTVTDRNELLIAYEAQTDRKTVINMTNHSFFNLSGDPSSTVLEDELYVNADQFTPLDATLVPTGDISPVRATPFDFTDPTLIGNAVARDTAHEQVKFAQGIDHNFVLNTKGDIRQLAARLRSPKSGIVLEVYSDQPGLQVYTGNMLDGSRTGKSGKRYGQHAAVCLETQHYPDSPNHPDFPSTTIERGSFYRQKCIYRFSVHTSKR